jgi:hypothetical protein
MRSGRVALLRTHRRTTARPPHYRTRAASLHVSGITARTLHPCTPDAPPRTITVTARDRRMISRIYYGDFSSPAMRESIPHRTGSGVRLPSSSITASITISPLTRVIHR